MSNWRDTILNDFVPQVSKLTLVADPDSLLTEETLVVLGALAAVMLQTLLALIAAGPLMKVLGARVEAVITRLLGVLLAALAAQ